MRNTNSVRLSSEIIDCERLTVANRAAMLELMQRHYDNVQPDRFFADLENKQWVILVREPQRRALCGFSTLAIVELDHDGRRLIALFSGDTVVDRRYWGDPALGQAWGRFILQWIERQPDLVADWFLISQGFRTYRYLSLFFREFYPRFDCLTPPAVADRLARFSTHLFGERFDAARGIILADPESYQLRNDLADVGGRARFDPHVDYFLRMNPGHLNGDELCCLAPLARENFTPAAWRVINRCAPVDVG